MIFFADFAHNFCTNYQKLFNKMTEKKLFHDPVLSQEILSGLLSEEIKTIFDGTLGLGGHAELILNKFPNISLYIASDLDNQHLEFAKKRLQKFSNKTRFFRGNFSNIVSILAKNKPEYPLVILLDLGLCSNQIDDAEKGFSFSTNGPLKMAFDGHNGAEEIVNNALEKELIRVFKEYGEEPLAKIIATEIIKSRKISEIKTTADLKNIIEGCIHPHKQKKALVRVFQALRIAVNDELNVLQKTIDDSFGVMKKGDRLGIISYHSLEDRIVKNKFRKISQPKTAETKFSLHDIVEESDYRLLTKKPIKPTAEEISRNPRSRSAVLRIIEKIK
jgi:16S rRNA (cytosine1402-N4)-methyltransferase